MKTVQQYFLEYDSQLIIDKYNLNYPLDYDYDLRNNSYLKCLYERNYKLKKLIHKIQHVQINESNDIYILLVSLCIEDDLENIEVNLVNQSELKNKFTQTYAYEFDYIENSAGFYIADTDLTQKHIYDVLASYLFESSFFGYDQEEIETTLEDLKLKSDFVSENIDKLLEDSKNCEFSYKEIDEEFFELENEYATYLNAKNNYAIKSFNLEKQRLIDLLEVGNE